MSVEPDLPKRAIVLDTNAFPLGPRAYRKPLLSLTTLASLADDAAAEGVEIWIPEVVVWELAEHAADYFAQGYPTWSAMARRLGRDGGVLGIPAPADLTAQEIHEQTEDAVSGVKNVRIISCRPESALAGLRDQVLQMGPATPKQGVKTGAADSAWVRDILAEADATTEFHLVSADADPLMAFRSQGEDPPRIHKSLRDLRSAVFHYDDTQVPEAVVELLDYLNDEDHWDPQIQLREPEVDGRLASEVPEGVVRLDVFPVMPFKVLGVGDVEITKIRGTISAHVALASTFELEGWTLSADAVLKQTFRATYEGGVLAADLVFDRWDGVLSGAHADDIVIAHGRHDRFDTPEDAKREVLQLLADFVPEVALVDEPHSAAGQRVDVSAFGGVEVDLADTPMGWDLVVRDGTSESECTVSCRYDDAAFVGGGREGEHSQPPYLVTAVPDLASLGRPTWAANAFLLDILQRRHPQRSPDSASS